MKIDLFESGGHCWVFQICWHIEYNTFHVLMQYCSLQHQTLLSPLGHMQNSVLFPLWLSHFILSGDIINCSPFFPSSILGIFWLGVSIFYCHIFLPFCIVHGILTARIVVWVVISSSTGPCFVRTFPDGPSVLDGMARLFWMAWPIYEPWLIASLSYASPFAVTRLWSMTARRNINKLDMQMIPL